MLNNHVRRYIALRQALGFKLRDVARRLHAFARFATTHGDTHVRASTVVEWATQAPSPYARHVRLRNALHLARFLHAEDPSHEVPPSNIFHAPMVRSLPYIYTPAEIARIIEAAGRLRHSKRYPLRGETYSTLLGLIAATGLRVSEALDLRLCDVLHDGTLNIRCAKLGKSRFVPLHPTVVNALTRYLHARRQLAVTDDHVFLSAGNRRISASMVNYTFQRILRLAEIVPARLRSPRIHDLRHTFATRALEQCSTRREAVGRHFVALATYLGHTDIVHTYWYLEATPELMTDIAALAEALVAREGT